MAGSKVEIKSSFLFCMELQSLSPLNLSPSSLECLTRFAPYHASHSSLLSYQNTPSCLIIGPFFSRCFTCLLGNFSPQKFKSTFLIDNTCTCYKIKKGTKEYKQRKSLFHSTRFSCPEATLAPHYCAFFQRHSRHIQRYMHLYIFYFLM